MKQRVLVENLHLLTSSTPDVPLAPGIDAAALVKADTDTGMSPFFITLPLSHTDQVSRNQRFYPGEVANNAIYAAITQRKIGGNKGHTPEHLRGSFFDVPVAHWVGAKIVRENGANVLYGKAYIPGDSERMRELRGYYARQVALGATVGTSLEGMATLTFNPETNLDEVEDLEIVRIDIVAGDSQTGIPLAGSRAPLITQEKNQMSDYQRELRSHSDTKQAAHELIAALRLHPDFGAALRDVKSIEEAAQVVQRVVDAPQTNEIFIIIPDGTTEPDPALESDYFVIPGMYTNGDV